MYLFIYFALLQIIGQKLREVTSLNTELQNSGSQNSSLSVCAQHVCLKKCIPNPSLPPAHLKY